MHLTTANDDITSAQQGKKIKGQPTQDSAAEFKIQAVLCTLVSFTYSTSWVILLT